MGSDAHYQGGTDMNKKLGRLFWPGLWVYFAVMALFVIAAALMQNYVLAASEFGVSVLVLVFYIINRNRRRNAVHNYAKSVFDVPQPAGNADLPFPMAMIRMGDSTVVWTNDAFCSITGYQPFCLLIRWIKRERIGKQFCRSYNKD